MGSAGLQWLKATLIEMRLDSGEMGRDKNEAELEDGARRNAQSKMVTPVAPAPKPSQGHLRLHWKGLSLPPRTLHHRLSPRTAPDSDLESSRRASIMSGSLGAGGSR